MRIVLGILLSAFALAACSSAIPGSAPPPQSYSAASEAFCERVQLVMHDLDSFSVDVVKDIERIGHGRNQVQTFLSSRGEIYRNGGIFYPVIQLGRFYRQEFYDLFPKSSDFPEETIQRFEDGMHSLTSGMTYINDLDAYWDGMNLRLFGPPFDEAYFPAVALTILFTGEEPGVPALCDLIPPGS